MNNVQPIESLKCTVDLQMTSLCKFMKALGYNIVRQYKGRVFFENPDNQHQPIVSFRTAVGMHNGKIVKRRWHSMSCTAGTSDDWWKKIAHQSIVKADPLSVYVAYKSRVVDRVKLQLNKKTGVVKAQSDVIKWASAAAEAAYSKELYS